MNLTALSLTALLILFVSPACAHTGARMDVEIVGEGGGSFSAIPFGDYPEGRTRVIKKYVEARKGENYSITLKNNMPERVGVVLAVDGRNIISGGKSSLKSNERMYILEPYGSARLDGWRTDDDTVHAFYFTDIGDSYAVRTFGDASAMGVIAVAAYREKRRPALYERNIKEKSAAPPLPAPSAKSSARAYEGDRSGTGFGDARHSPVIKVKFEPEEVAFEKVLVKYEWHEFLCKKGLVQCVSRKGNRLWDENEYAPYPPGYNER